MLPHENYDNRKSLELQECTWPFFCAMKACEPHRTLYRAYVAAWQGHTHYNHTRGRLLGPKTRVSPHAGHMSARALSCPTASYPLRGGAPTSRATSRKDKDTAGRVCLAASLYPLKRSNYSFSLASLAAWCSCMYTLASSPCAMIVLTSLLLIARVHPYLRLTVL